MTLQKLVRTTLETLNMGTNKYVTSLEVSELIGKEHFILMRDIRNYLKDIQLSEPNTNLYAGDYYIESSYHDKQNQIRPMFYISKRGCEMIGNKMTGTKGNVFTAAYVDAFNIMQEQLKDSYMIDNPIERAKRWIQEKEESIKLEEKIKLDAPKVKAYEEVIDSKNGINTTIIAKEFGISATTLNKLLLENKIQYYQGGKYNLYQKYCGLGYEVNNTHTYKKTNGSRGSSLQLKWTQKGRIFLHEFLTNIEYKRNGDK